MNNAQEAGWKCGTCWVQNAATAQKCAACETLKEPEVYNGPPIMFGGGPSAPIDITKPSSLFITRPSTPNCNTPQAVAQAPLTFCKAMNTPVGRAEPVFLIGCDVSDLIDKTDCLGTLKVHPGTLMTWGSGECDQLPVRSDLTDEYNGLLKPAPIRAFLDGSVTKITCGSLTSYALRENNEVWSWGCPDNGPLGRPIKSQDPDLWAEQSPPCEDVQITSGKVPERVWGLPSDDKIVKIVAGDSHAGVLTESGDVYLWGHYRDFTGPLGFWNGAEIVETQWFPMKITLPGVALDIASGENHTVILVQNSTSRDQRCLIVMGSNEFGQLCTIPSLPTLPPEVGGATSFSMDQNSSILTPVEISPDTYMDLRHQYLKPHVIPLEKLVLCKWKKITNHGGKPINEFEEMFKSSDSGGGGSNNVRSEDLKITKVCAGSSTTFIKVVDAGESLWFACGRGTYGELGGGFTEQAMYNPTLISMPNLCAFETIIGGDFATFALSSDGSIWAWGKGDLCGLGSNAEQKILIPKAIPGLRNKCQSMNCGMKTTYALTHAGYVFVWGEGNNYQLGTGINDDLVVIPTRIPPEFFDNEAVVDIAAGSNHVVGLINMIIERRGAKRTRMLDEVDELPSVMKKTRMESQCTPEATAQTEGLIESLTERTSLMFLPAAPSPTDTTPLQHPPADMTPKFPNVEMGLRGAGANPSDAAAQSEGMAQVLADYLENVNAARSAPPAAPSESNQRVTLMPHYAENEVVPQASDVTAMHDDEEDSHHEFGTEQSDDEQESMAVDAASGVAVDISATETVAAPTSEESVEPKPETPPATGPEINSQRLTLMPHDAEDEVPAPKAAGDTDFSEDEEMAAGESNTDQSDEEPESVAADSPSEVECDISVAETAAPLEVKEPVESRPATAKSAASTRKASPKTKRATPANKTPEISQLNKTPVSKPRDSLTAVLISADRPYDDTPKPSQGEYEPQRELEKAVDGDSDKGEGEGKDAAPAAKGRGKARAKPKAKSKAKAKAKGRPGRKPKAAAGEEAVAAPAAEEEASVAEEVPARRAPVRRTRATKTRQKEEDSGSSAIDSGDEDVDGAVTAGASTAKKTAAGRGRAKAKVRVVNKKK